MMTVKEVSDLTGISIRTLHYYDEIGLLSPAKVETTGYRLYDHDSLKRLQQILLFRELEFPLRDIRRIIDIPGFDRRTALDDQIRLLTLKRDHLENLIAYANQMKLEEEVKMSFEAFDKSRIDAYKQLAKEKWGGTDAYKEYEAKAAAQTDTEKRQASEDLMKLFFEFGDLKALAPESASVQAQVKKLQDFITSKYYTCTGAILKGLGQMYRAGGEMTQNIDVAGGTGTAQFVADAIEIYCGKNRI